MMVGDYTRAKQMRALMVVLPYSASIKDDASAMQELFNKPPVTRVIESEVKPMVMIPVTQKPTPATTLAFTTTTRRSTTQLAIPDDYAAMAFKALPVYDKMFPTTNSRDKQQQQQAQKALIPNELEAILKEMKIVNEDFQSTTARSDNNGQVAPDVKDVLQSLGLWEDNESPMVFSKQTVSEHFAPIELDFKTGTVRTVEKPTTESVNKRMKAPEITPTDFVSFKPIPKLEKSEVEFENYEYFKSIGLLDSSKESRAYTSSPEVNKPVVSKKAQGFTRRKSDVSYETDILKQISKQEREQLLDVLKKLEKQVVAGKIGPNPLDHTEINLTKNDYKRQEEATESVEPEKFSFNFNSDDKDTKETVSIVTPTPETLSDDLPSTPDDSQGRIVNKGSVTSEESSDSTTTTSTTAAPSTTESSDAETFSLPPLDDLTLDNLEDMGGLDPLADAMPPPEKKNGFYFLADWNSFLEVGEGKDRVEVRFTPKVGDSRLFIPVTVP